MRQLSAKAAFLAPAAMIALVWPVGYGVYAWKVHQKAEDARARYEPVDLHAAAFPPTGSHVALRGGTVVPGLVLNHVTNPGGPSEKVEYRLVPIVPTGWKPGEPVRFVLKAEDPRDFQDLLGPPGQHGAPEGGSFLARIGGTVSTAAAMKFNQAGAPLAEPFYVLTRVPALDGKPVDTSVDFGILEHYVIPSGMVTAIFCLLALGVWIVGRLKAARPLR